MPGIAAAIPALQSNARHRRLIVPQHRSRTSAEHDAPTPGASTAPLSWMARLHRVFGIDVAVCPLCAGQLRVTGVVTEPIVIARILQHLRGGERHPCTPCAPPPVLAS